MFGYLWRQDKLKEEEEEEQQSARIMELESELAKKNDVIKDLEESEKALVGRCKSLENCEAELSEKLKVMMAINSHVGDKDHEVVAVNTSRNSDRTNQFEKEINDLKETVDKLNKKNSLLKDQLVEKTEALKKVDQFYKEIIDQKDQVIHGYLAITKTDNGSEMKLKRLLEKFRADQELKFVNELKSTLVEPVTEMHTSGTVEKFDSNGNKLSNEVVHDSCADESVSKDAGSSVMKGAHPNTNNGVAKGGDGSVENDPKMAERYPM